MNKNLGIKTGLILLSLKFSELVTYAYEIDPSYKPINQPFAEALEKYADSGDKTIVILQIISGGLLYFAAPVAVIMIVQAGFAMVTGGGDTEKTEQAKKHLIWALLGMLLIILSYSVVRAIINFAIKASEIGN